MTIPTTFPLTSSDYILSFQTVPGSEVLALWLESRKQEMVCLGHYTIATQLTLRPMATTILSDMALLEVLALARGYALYRRKQFAGKSTLAKANLQRA